MELENRIRKKLDEAFAAPWGTSGVLRSQIDLSDASTNAALAGKLSIHKYNRAGDEVLVREYSFEGLRTTDDTDDFVAEALSDLLANHASWPR